MSVLAIEEINWRLFECYLEIEGFDMVVVAPDVVQGES
jgi:hypothetical protein